ncbi:recombinase family protein [Salinibacterium sp. NG253]|uniref:recombinase family protein n=1 Tax=Salinibacterium sp. NG253 TaxID=2792039 RepID=UPI0035A8B0D5
MQPKLGVDPRRIYVDQGLSGRKRERPRLRGALAACHEGAALAFSKLDRLGVIACRSPRRRPSG